MSLEVMIEGSHVWPIHQVLQRLKIEQLRCVEPGFPASGPWAAGISHWYRQGSSIRATEVELESGRLSIRILAGSAPADYKLAFALAINFAQIAQARLSLAGGTPLDVAAFRDSYNDDWIRAQVRESLKSVLSPYLQHAQEQVRMVTMEREFVAGPRLRPLLLLDPARIAPVWFEKVLQFNFPESHQLSRPELLVANTPAGVRRRAVFYRPGHACLLWAKADLVGLPLHADADEAPILIPFDKLVDLLGDRAQWLSEDHLRCPALDEAAWREFYTAAVKHQAGVGEVAEGHGPSHAELALLSLIPAVLFLMVGGIDGEIDRKEFDVFTAELAALSEVEGLLGAMSALALAEANLNMERYLGSVLSHIDSEETTAAAVLNMASMVNDGAALLEQHLDAGKAQEAKQRLFRLATAIAGASGGKLLGLGSKISPQEQAALDLIMLALE
ncbi:hypothetical protein [Chitinimonas naiadis]